MTTEGEWVPMRFDYAIIHFSDYQKYGCPRCGNFDCYTSMSGGGTTLVTCSNRESCGVGYAIVHDSLDRSTIGFGTKDGDVYPEVQKHPRKGIPGHERTQER